MGLLLSLGSMKYASMLNSRATHLLLVDDNQNGLLARKSLLEEQGFVITTATNGEEAFDAFSKGKFGLLITDFRMPKMNGVELIRRIRPLQPALGIILISGFADAIGRIHSEKESCTGSHQHEYSFHLTSPFYQRTFTAT